MNNLGIIVFTCDVCDAYYVSRNDQSDLRPLPTSGVMALHAWTRREHVVTGVVEWMCPQCWERIVAAQSEGSG